MSLGVLDTLKGGLKDSLSSKGLKFMGLAYLINLIGSISSQSLLSQLGFYNELGAAYTMTALAMEGPLPLWTGLSLIGFLAGLWLALGVLRNFVDRSSEEIDTDLFTENLGMPFLNLLIGGILFSVAVGLGFLLFIVPGIFLLVSLFFWTVYVAVEDENFIDAMKSSWSLARGNRLSLLLIVLGIAAVWIFASILVGIPGAVVSNLSPQMGALIGVAADAFSLVFT